MVYTTHRNGDEWGMVYYCYTNIMIKRGLKLDMLQIPDFQTTHAPQNMGETYILAWNSIHSGAGSLSQ